MPNAKLIGPILDTLATMLRGMKSDTLDTLPAFAEVKVGMGLSVNSPSARVMPRKTVFTDDQGQSRAEVHLVTIRLGITGSDPDELTARMVKYVTAVDAAIEKMQDTEWPDYVLSSGRFVTEHDYGAIYSGNNGLACWPEIHVAVKAEEWR